MSSLQQDDRILIKNAVEKFIDDNYSFEDKKHRLDSSGIFGGCWSTFAELGWLMLTVSEEAGGLGGGVADAQVLLRAFGRGLISEPYIEVVVQAAKTLELCQTDTAIDCLASLISGEQKYILAHAETKALLDFSVVNTVAIANAEGYELSGKKCVVWEAAAADYLLVSAKFKGEPALFLVAANETGVSLKTTPTVDGRQAADITFEKVQITPASLLAEGVAAVQAIQQAVLFTFATLAGEVEGIASSLCQMTAKYLNTREQFGTKIANFQALQHLFADMVIAEEEIKSLAWIMGGVWEVEDTLERERLIRSAKARMCTAGRELAETAVQLHGGIGVSDELIVGHYLRRIIAIDSWYGDSQQQTLWLAKQI